MEERARYEELSKLTLSEILSQNASIPTVKWMVEIMDVICSSVHYRINSEDITNRW